MIVETSTAEIGNSKMWQDRAQRAVALVLLLCLVWGITNSYSKEQTRRMLCEYECDSDEVPVRIIREFLNGGPDGSSLFHRGGLDDDPAYDEDQPVESPCPDDENHYYALSGYEAHGEAVA